MAGQSFGQSCCTTTPRAMCSWGVAFAVFYGVGLLLRHSSPAFQHYGDTVALTALAAACFVNFRSNRTLHCGITGPVFAAAAIVALLGEGGAWNVNEPVLWLGVLAAVALALFVEWRMAGRASSE
jgi:hypothetical protein